MSREKRLRLAQARNDIRNAGGDGRARSASAVADDAINDESLSPILRTCAGIQHSLLRRIDPQLHRHLVEEEIEPQLYCMKWVRLIFGREFHMEDVLTLWDGIFSECLLAVKGAVAPMGGGAGIVSTVEHLAMVMIIYIREFLLVNENMKCLQRLMKCVYDVGRGLTVKAG
jgi:hypothetical protein